MTAELFNDLVQQQIKRCTDILLAKQSEYAPDAEKLHNFKQAAALQGCSVRQACGGFLAKHIISVFDMINAIDKEYGLHIWNEKITDAINYLLILRVIVSEELINELEEETSVAKLIKTLEHSLDTMPQDRFIRSELEETTITALKTLVNRFKENQCSIVLNV